MEKIKNIGICLFLIGFVYWFYLLNNGKCVLTPQIFKANTGLQIQNSLGIDIEKLYYQNQSPFVLSFDIQQIINQKNEYFKDNQAWDKVIYDDELPLRIVRASLRNDIKQRPMKHFWLTFGLMILGALFIILSNIKHRKEENNHAIFHRSLTSRGILGWLLGLFLILFYIVLYFYPHFLVNTILIVDPISQLLNGNEASRWFLYGFIYTLCVLIMGVRMLIKHRGIRYQQYRTLSVMFFQLIFAFLLPEILISLNLPYFDFKNLWPLDYDFFFEYNLNTLVSSGHIGLFMLVWGIVLFVIGVPIMTYFYGKRWYCSWVCGCGGLAETLGDPFRQLSDKSHRAWKIERYLIYSVFVMAVMMTVLVLYTYFTGQSHFLGLDSYYIRSLYGFWIGSIFAGVIGTGFYPILGNRAWCRFGCPLAAYLGFWQKKNSKFRITTNGGQCISCGNCSTYCEMGIDVRAYAQQGQDIVRASCVGCGICSAVCPRGVLNLENL